MQLHSKRHLLRQVLSKYGMVINFDKRHNVPGIETGREKQVLGSTHDVRAARSIQFWPRNHGAAADSDHC